LQIAKGLQISRNTVKHYRDRPAVDGGFLYLPLVVAGRPPDPTPTPTATAEMSLPTATLPPPASDLRIVELSGGSTPEYVTVQNVGIGAQEMTGWTVESVIGPQTFSFPAGYVLGAGATVRIESHTGAVHNPPAVLRWGLAAYQTSKRVLENRWVAAAVWCIVTAVLPVIGVSIAFLALFSTV
jgi:hypothetical protein